MDPQLEQPGITVDQDIPCSDCGYNLRGVDRRGLCPECGLPIGTSSVRWRLRQGRALSAADPNWTRQLLVGAILLCMAIAIQLLAVAIDIGASLGEYQGFTVLALLCIAWIVAGFAAIELTCLPGGLVSSYEDERWRKWFRYCAVAYGGMPLLWGITDGGWALGDGVAIWYILTGALAVATALALFQHLSKLADRAEAGWLAATLELLGLAYVPAMALWALEFSSENGRGGDNSYNLMITLPLPVQGPATFSRELVGGAFSAWQQTSMSTTFLLLALIWLITPALLIWFILAIWRNVRNAAKDCEIPPNSDARQRSNRPDFR